MIAPPLKKGDTIRIIAPARSMALPWVAAARAIAAQHWQELGCVVTYAKHIEECDSFDSSSIDARIEDLHEAFADPEVKLIQTVIGGFNSNQLLERLDFELIRNNPKRLCGYSDITALGNAIYAKTGLVTYSGPHFFNFGEKQNFEYTRESFYQCMFGSEPYLVQPSEKWSDDRWSTNQDQRHFYPNEGYWVFNQGEAQGKILGGNLCTLQLLQGTQYWPDITNSLLFIEEDDFTGALTAVAFDRNLQSLIHQPGFETVRAVIIGRFLPACKVSHHQLTEIIKSKEKLKNIPVIGNVDFGHTSPMCTLPIGGKARLKVQPGNVVLEILEH